MSIPARLERLSMEAFHGPGETQFKATGMRMEAHSLSGHSMSRNRLVSPVAEPFDPISPRRQYTRTLDPDLPVQSLSRPVTTGLADT